jgi:hypothetical protein
MSPKTRSFMQKFHNVFEETNKNLFLKLSELYSYAHYIKNSQRRQCA